MTRVTSVGLAVHDVIFSVAALPSGPGKTHATSRREVGGGPAANAAVAIAALGTASRLVSVIGDDVLGESILSDLIDRGVDVSQVWRQPDRLSPVSAVTVDPSGERSIVNHTDPDLFAGTPTPEYEVLSGSNAVLVDVRWPAGARSSLAWAAAHGVPGVVDFDLGYSEPGQILGLASHVIFSAPALAKLTGNDDPESGLRTVASDTEAWLAVTIGDRGSVWLDAGAIRHQAGFDVEVVDTTGAGDVFHGVFAESLARGMSEESAMRRASAAAAISCTKVGGRDGAPTTEQLEAFIEEHT